MGVRMNPDNASQRKSGERQRTILSEAARKGSPTRGSGASSDTEDDEASSEDGKP
jgi:hypothetical protein